VPIPPGVESFATTSPNPPTDLEPATIRDVIEQMRALEAALPATDGVAFFNHLYLRVTEAVAAAITAGVFVDRAFMERLDVIFAGYYLRAVHPGENQNGASTPRAWAPLFESRNNRKIAPIQFAVCGMNAHINHDLPLALVDAYLEVDASGDGGGPERKTDRFQDYRRVNAILDNVQTLVKGEFDTGVFGAVDHFDPEGVARIAHWSIEDARDGAWSNGQVLWHIKSNLFVRDTFLDSLDRVVGLAGRGLLITQ
jgi:hypothetical protein